MADYNKIHFDPTNWNKCQAMVEKALSNIKEHEPEQKQKSHSNSNSLSR